VEDVKLGEWGLKKIMKRAIAVSVSANTTPCIPRKRHEKHQSPTTHGKILASHWTKISPIWNKIHGSSRTLYSTLFSVCACAERFRILGITFVAPTFRQFSYRYFHINFAFKRLQVGKNEAIQISSTANITSSYACLAGSGPSLEDSTPSFTTLTLSSYCRRGSLSF